MKQNSKTELFVRKPLNLNMKERLQMRNEIKENEELRNDIGNWINTQGVEIVRNNPDLIRILETYEKAMA